MELSVDRLRHNKDPRAESLCAFIDGVVQMDLATLQHEVHGTVLPWSHLVRFNHYKFPLWNESAVDGFVELSGEFLSSLDKSFGSEMRKLLGLERNRSLVFDMDYAKHTLTIDTMSFLYNSGLIAWYTPRDLESPHPWLISVRNPGTVCLYKESYPKYVVLDSNNSEQVGIEEADRDAIIDLLIKHIVWHQADTYMFTCGQLEWMEDYVGNFKDALSNLYEVSYYFSQLHLTRIGG